MDARRGRPLGMAAVFLFALAFAGCGSSSSTTTSSSTSEGGDTAFEAEVRGAMEGIGNFVRGHEALKEASRMKRVTREEARQRVESKGLVGYGCKETNSGWQC